MPASHDASEVANGGKTFVDIIVGDVEMSLAAKFANGSEDSAAVAVLVVALHFAVGEDGISHFGGCKIDRSAYFSGFVDEYLCNFGLVLADDDRSVGFDNSSFFVRDFGKSSSEKVGVVDADISDDAEFGRDDVGAVEATTKTDFDDSNVDLLLSKIAERHCRSDFEERWLEFGNERLCEFDKFAYSFFGNHFAIDAYAFAEIFEVRRGVEAHFVASRL